MSIEHADLPIAALQFPRESPWRSGGAHHYRHHRAGQLADQGTTGIAPPCDPGRPERRNIDRMIKQAQNEVEALLG
jgi:hypothetical protein